MENIKNVSEVVKKANVYYDGKVTSRTLFLTNGQRQTLGFLVPGEYEFSTGDKEHMEMLAGSVEVLIPGSNIWAGYKEGDIFDIPANCKFKMKALKLSDYLCSYISE